MLTFKDFAETPVELTEMKDWLGRPMVKITKVDAPSGTPEDVMDAYDKLADAEVYGSNIDPKEKMHLVSVLKNGGYLARLANGKIELNKS